MDGSEVSIFLELARYMLAFCLPVGMLDRGVYAEDVWAFA